MKSGRRLPYPLKTKFCEDVILKSFVNFQHIQNSIQHVDLTLFFLTWNRFLSVRFLVNLGHSLLAKLLLKVLLSNKNIVSSTRPVWVPCCFYSIFLVQKQLFTGTMQDFSGIVLNFEIFRTHFFKKKKKAMVGCFCMVYFS